MRSLFESDASDYAKKISRGSLAQILMALIGFGSNLILARIVGPQKLGLFYLILAVAQIGRQPIQGIQGAITKRISEKQTENSQLIGLSFAFYTIFIVSVSVLLYIFRTQLQDYLKLEYSWLYVLAGIIILGLLTIVESLLNGLQKYDVWLGLDTLRTFFTFPLQLILVYSIGATLGLYFGLLSATILIFPIASLFITFSISTPSKATINSVFDFAVYSLASGFIGTLYNNSSKLLLGFFFTPTLVGNYEVAAIFAFPAFFIASVLKDALTPEISNLKSKNKNFLPSIQNSRNFASIIAIPVFAGSLGVGKELIATTYGTQYATASVFLAAICLLRVFMSQTRIIGSIFAGLDQPQENTKFLTMSFIIFVLLTLPYIHFFSYIGIIYAMITAEAIRYLTSIVFLRTNYEIQVAFLPKEIAYQLLSALTMTITIKLLTNYILPENLTLPLVLALIGIGASIYFATLIIISSYIRRTIFTLLNF